MVEPPELRAMLWQMQVANAHCDASLVAEPEMQAIGPRVATPPALDAMTDEAARSGFNVAARMEVIGAVDPASEALGFPMLRCPQVEGASTQPHLRVLWVITLLDGVPTNWLFDVSQDGFCALPHAPFIPECHDYN